MALRLDEWRRAKKLTQPELAKECGVSVTSIRFWEAHPDRIQIRYIPIIANALGVDQKDIIFLPNEAK